MQSEQTGVKKRRNPRTVVSGILILVAIPLTIAVGILFLKDRSYYLISLLILGYTMLPFFMTFEKRKPQARELIVIAVLCAIGVVGRILFAFLPQFKPISAVVIIAGICFGPETGFLTGAVSAFVSNFYFGQGPFTPWQMFCLGIIGFLSGILFHTFRIPKSKTIISVYGGIAVFFVYGGIINISVPIVTYGTITLQMLLTSYAAAFYMDLIHAGATVVFLFLLSDPMLEKLERIKIKYGLVRTGPEMR